MRGLVSVLTPSYNYGEFIRDAIASVQHQSEVEVEHVIQDGASTDDTLTLLAASNTVDWQSQPDTGQPEALNRALTRASGDWIAWLNADEFYLPSGLRTLVEVADRTSADVVYGDAAFVDVRGRFERLVPQHSFNEFVLRYYGCYIASCAALFRRSALASQAWDPDLHRILDWDLYLCLALQGRKFVHVSYPVGAFRRHADQISARPLDEFRNILGLLQARYSLDKSRSKKAAAYALHALLKARNGGYLRELGAGTLRGRDLRWFLTPTAEAAVDLLHRAYPRSVHGSMGFQQA